MTCPSSFPLSIPLDREDETFEDRHVLISELRSPLKSASVVLQKTSQRSVGVRRAFNVATVSGHVSIA
ncbi:unnamed protein product [Strongylus vulgaris]|uniref:Uncharacterized protein n=1 Tax=Strongylus vulgaris TaxID=40348 RepID=A0A3P7IW84_STRVU|nr:unnamed protein product [Strongylus vulgaris]